MPANPPSVFYDSKPSQKLGLLWAAVTAHGVWVASYGIDEVEFLHHIQERGPARPQRSATQPAPALRQMDEFLRGAAPGL